MDTIRYTSCGYHCECDCVLKVHVRDGVIVACEPDDTINPGLAREDEHLAEDALNRGMVQARMCAKGYTQVRMLYDPKRVKYPMKRVGRRGEAKFERISWDEALDAIARKLVEVKKDYGPFSIMHNPYSNLSRCSLPIAPWFGAGFAGWGTHSLGGLEEPVMWVLGKDTAHQRKEINQDEANIFKSRLIVLWGGNYSATLSSAFVYNLLRAKERGIPIICIEPRYTPTAEVVADQWIPIRPTTDVAMMIAMANVWFKEGLCDQEFIEKWVEPEGLRRWKAYVLGTGDGVDKTPQWGEGICGVPAETIAEFARLYARSKPVNLNVAGSLGRQFYGENPVRASIYLQALTGNACTPGGTAVTLLYNGHATVPLPAVDYQRRPGTYKPPVLMCSFKWLKAIDLREKLDRGEIGKEEYNTTIGNVAGNEPPNIRMAILESNNLLNSLPDINAGIRAMNRLDFVVVSSYYAEMPSARYADILLPQIATAFEGRDDLGHSMSARNPFRSARNLANYFVYRQKCVDPPGEIKSSEWVWVQIARRLGIAEQYSPRLADVPDNEWDEAVEDLYREAYEKWALREDVAALKPPGWQEFQKKPVFRWETKDAYYPFKKDLDAGKNPFRGTPSGKLEFYSEGLSRGADHLATHEFFAGSGKCYGGGNLPPMAQMTTGGGAGFHSEDTERYPLLMSSPHSYYRVHSFLDNQALLKDDCYRHAIWINVSDARARGIKDDDPVRVYNELGEMVVPAYVTGKIVPGTVCLFHGGWYVPDAARSPTMPEGIDTRGSPSLLIHNRDLPQTVLGYYPCQGLVQIEKWRGAP
ncbi:MAG: molybdopterin-dependent oxidoreductase [Chloroflexi bacterium]|nr:molybdopterin-dependent oxidoreductase [Chloroflexota bacterium]